VFNPYVGFGERHGDDEVIFICPDYKRGQQVEHEVADSLSSDEIPHRIFLSPGI
jgi:hypothetical protein